VQELTLAKKIIHSFAGQARVQLREIDLSDLDSVVSFFLKKRNGSRTCLVHFFGRAGTNLGRGGLR
jgi:hypothetical protein